MSKPTETQTLLLGIVSHFVDVFLQIEADAPLQTEAFTEGGKNAIRQTVSVIGLTEIFERMLAERKGRSSE